MSFDYEILSQNDLLELFPFGRSKLNALLRAGVLPVTKVGRDYITTRAELDRWFAANRGREIFYYAKQQLATFEPCTVRCLEYFKP